MGGCSGGADGPRGEGRGRRGQNIRTRAPVNPYTGDAAALHRGEKAATGGPKSVRAGSVSDGGSGLVGRVESSRPDVGSATRRRVSSPSLLDPTYKNYGDHASAGCTHGAR